MNRQLFFTAVFTILCNLCNAQSLPSYVPSEGLLGWWPFTGSANDLSINGNNGTVNGAIMTADRFGNPNAAYLFNGVDSFISVPNSTSFQNISAISTSAWIYVEDWYLSNDNSWFPIISKSSTTTAGKFSVGVTLSKIYGNLDLKQAEINQNLIQPGSWYNIVMVHNGNTAKFYINGILYNTTTAFTTLPNFVSTLPLFFGKDNPGLTEFSNGKIDDIGIWNRELTDNEINNLYNSNICYQNITVTDTLIINTGILSYNPVTYNNTITIYPNPANDHITIDCGTLANVVGYQIKIINTLGQEVFSSVMNQQQFSVPLNSWTGNGLYFVNILNTQGHIIDIKKIILQ